MSRDAFLARVRRAAEAGRAYRVHVDDDPTRRVGYVGGGDDLCQSMADEVVRVGGKSWLVDTWTEARRVVGELLDTHVERPSGAAPSDERPRTALGWQHPVLARVELPLLLAERQIQWLDYDALNGLPFEQQRAAMLAADVGITSCTHAIAETGSLAMASQPGRERLASLLPPVHIAIVSRDQILPDLFDLFQQYSAETLPSNLVLITGPSKTGDIELQLTTGVHGPGTWHVVVVRESI